MAMSMSTKSSKTPRSSDTAIASIAKVDSKKTAKEKPRPVQHSATASSTRVVTDSPPTEEARHDNTRAREKAFNLQRIQLAEQLRNERQLSTDLEARIAGLQDELARLTRSKEACETECAELRRQIDEAIQQHESQITASNQREEDMSRRTSDLESKLEEVTKSLEESTLNCSLLQESHAHAARECDDQSTKIKRLESQLILNNTKAHDRDKKYCELEELYRNIVTENEATQKALLAQVEHYKSQASQEHHMLNKAMESRDKYLAESEKLQQSVEKLEKPSKPFAQTIVICVDISGSATGVIHDIRQAYRDVLHIIKSINSSARVAIVVHGEYSRRLPSLVQEISESTFQIMDSSPIGSDTEDYSYCLIEALDILRAEVGRGLVILIGDGNAVCSDVPGLLETCNQFKSYKMLVHSIIISDNSNFIGFTMSRITETIGGQVENKNTYMRAFDEILRRERENYFKGL
ncbi:hypothetical protein F4806DRAFT_466885 [Annulohypoxylon nitens]|nr:hypothetical protein F4806DRAFT_466885 [Annulohypoxylon nitens]